MLKNIVKIIFFNVVLIFFLILIFEFIFHQTGREFKKKYLKPYYGSNEFGRGTYPKNYFINDDILGFDIRPEVSPINFYSPNGILQIFSNEYGCFDLNTKYNNYIYLAGDSFAWGYDNYEKLFGTKLQNKLNKDVAKCGVTNTGQEHQFLKFQKFLNKNLISPKKIIVTHYKNDLSDDAKFPKDIVLNGWLVKKPKNSDEKRKLKDKIRKKEQIHKKKLNNNLIYFLKNHHFSIYLINNSFFVSALREFKSKLQNKNKINVKISKNNNSINCNYENYNKNTCINKNKDAINKFISYSKKNNIDLIFILYPPIDSLKNKNDIYMNLKRFLEKNTIRFVDLYTQILNSGIKIDKFYNRDGHFSEYGNNFLIKENINLFK